MPIPEGYEKLAVIGIVNKGEYSGGGEYKQYNYVYYEGSTYLALKDNPTVPPTNNKVDWQYLAQGVVGAKGDKGEPGAKGEQGVSITDARIEEGVLHITLSDERDITVGSVAITKDAIVDALGYTPADQEDVLRKGEVDGRNLFVMGDSEPGFLSDQNNGTIANATNNNEKTSDYIPASVGDTFTIQASATSFDDHYCFISYMWFSDKEPEFHIGNRFRFGEVKEGFWNKTVTTAPAPADAKYIRVDARFYNDGKIKVERGTIATDWTPAPEDVVVKSEFNSYIVNGEIITSRDGTAKGVGTATIVTLPNKLAMVYFDAKVTTAGSNDTGRWGISSKTLKKINTNVPNIIPMFGGSINIFKNGIKDSVLNGYGACMSSDNDYWAPCRMYDFNNVTFGPWADSSATVDLQINGVCFGTVSQVTTATADEPVDDTEIN